MCIAQGHGSKPGQGGGGARDPYVIGAIAANFGRGALTASGVGSQQDSKEEPLFIAQGHGAKPGPGRARDPYVDGAIAANFGRGVFDCFRGWCLTEVKEGAFVYCPGASKPGPGGARNPYVIGAIAPNFGRGAGDCLRGWCVLQSWVLAVIERNSTALCLSKGRVER